MNIGDIYVSKNKYNEVTNKFFLKASWDPILVCSFTSLENLEYSYSAGSFFGLFEISLVLNLNNFLWGQIKIGDRGYQTCSTVLSIGTRECRLEYQLERDWKQFVNDFMGMNVLEV